MENPQAQMPQGQPGQAPEQMQQGQPQEGGQDQQMQQVMQFVQQALQQGAQPADVAAQLLQSQVPPEIIMQVFVQMGMPQEEAQRNIEQAMQGGGQQPQGPGEEGMEGAMSNPQEEAAEQSMAPMEQGMAPEGIPMPEEGAQPQMGFGGLFSHNRRIKNKKNVINNYYGYPPYGGGGNDLYGGNYKTNYGNNYPQSGQDNAYTNTTQGQNDFPSLQSAVSSNEPPVPYSASDEIDAYQKRVEDEQAANRRGPNNGGNWVKDWTETGGPAYTDGFPRFSDGQFGPNGYTPPYGYANGGAIRQYANGGSVVDQLNEMIKSNVDPREIMKQVQAAAQQGAITPEQATAMMESLQSMGTAQDPQANDLAMTEGSQDPQQYNESMAIPDQSMGMAEYGGKIKRNLLRAYGGPAVAPGADSRNYAKDRSTMFVNSVKGDMFKATLNDTFPSLSGKSMAYGGLVKAEKGINLKEGKVEIDPTKYKSEEEYLADLWKWNSNPDNAKNLITSEQIKDKKWIAPKNTSSFQRPQTYFDYQPKMGWNRTGMTPEEVAYEQEWLTNHGSRMPNYGYGQMPYGQQNPFAVNPVGYANPLATQYGQLFNQASPWAKTLAGLGLGQNFSDPRITGSNLPGGMDPMQFLGAIGGVDKLASGMTGKIGDQTWRINSAEKFKEGSIWKGNRRKGVRYNVDWGNAAAMNPAAPGYNPTAAGPGLSGYNADANGNGIADYLELASTPAASANNVASPVINSTTANIPGSSLSVAQGKAGFINPNGDFSEEDLKVQDELNRQAEEKNKAFDNYPTDEDFPSMKPQSRSLSKPNVSEPVVNSNSSVITNTSNASAIPTATVSNAPVTIGTKDEDKVELTPEQKAYKESAEGMANRNKFEREDSEWNVLSRKDNKTEDEQKKFTALSAEREAHLRKVRPDYYKSFGGGINPQALQNAIQLINRAFGGMIPQAGGGLEVGADMKPVGFSTDPNSMVWKDPNKTMPSIDNPNPQNQGQVEASDGNRFKPNSLFGDQMMTSMNKLTNFANKVNNYNPQREAAANSALFRPREEFQTMSQGLYGQQGDMLANRIGNQVLNPTDISYNNQSINYGAFGGRIYELGGDFDIDDTTRRQLEAAGFKLTRI